MKDEVTYAPKKMAAEKTVSRKVKDKGRILIVEDNLLSQKLAGFMLKDWGFGYTICSNGRLALDALASGTYDLILMDIQMPELNGYETTEYIRKILNLTMPIIAMTAYVRPGEKEKCLRAGMTDYISKPINEPDLHEMITHYLSSTNPKPDNHAAPQE